MSLPDLAKQGVRTRFFGRRDRVPARLQARWRASRRRRRIGRLQLWIAFDYGGRAELVEARADPRGGRRPQAVSEEAIARASTRLSSPTPTS